MRLLHLSDEHVEKFPDEAERVITFAASLAGAESVSLIASCGDWFDGPLRPEQRLAGCHLFQRLAAAAPVAIVAGNHGAVKDVALLGALETLHPVCVAVEPTVAYFAPGDTPAFLDAPQDTDGLLLIAMLPWLRKIDLAMAADAKAVRRGADVGELAMAEFRRILERFHEAIARHNGPSIVLAHADVVRGERSKGNPAVGEELVIPAGWLTGLGADAVLLGHEHGRQEVAPGCWYSGAPRRIAFGETEDKGVQIVDVDRGRPPVVEFVPTPCARMDTIESEWTPDGLVMSTSDAKAGDRVKLRYTVGDEQAVTARAVAAEQRRLYAEAGITVEIEERIEASVRSRGGEQVAAAPSTWERALLYWQAKGRAVAAVRHGRLQAWLAKAEDACDVRGAMARARSAAVRFGAVRISGIGPFREEQAVDFDKLPGPIVALTGRKGEGKTTLLSALFALVYHKTPDGTWKLPDRATRKGYIDGTLRAGDGWVGRHRIEVDGKTRAIDCYAWGEDGAAVEGTKRGGTAGFDRHVEEHFADPTLMLAGPFAAQFGAEDPIEAGPTDRKNQLVTAMGLDPLQRMAEWFDAQIAPPKKAGGKPGLRAVVDALQQRLVAEQRQAEGALEADAAVTRALGAVDGANALLADALAVEQRARDALAAHAARLAELVAEGKAARDREKAASERHADARSRWNAARERAGEAQARVEEVRAGLAAAEQASEQAAQLGALETAAGRAFEEERVAREGAEATGRGHAAATARQTEAGAAFTVAAERLQAAAREASAAAKQVRQAEEGLAAAQHGAARLSEVQEAVAALPGADEKLAEAQEAQQEVADRITRSERWDVERAAALASAVRTVRDAVEREMRGKTARDRVAGVPCGGPDAQPTCEFLRDAAAVDLHALAAGAAAARDAEARLTAEPRPDWYIEPAARKALRDEATIAANDASRERTRIAAVAALLPEIEKRAAEVEAAAARVDEARAALAAAEERHAAALRACADAKSAYDAATKRARAEADLATGAAKLLRAAAATRTAAEKARDDARKAVERAGALDVLRESLAAAERAHRAAAGEVDTAALALNEAAGAVSAAAGEVKQLLEEHAALKAAAPTGPNEIATNAARRTLSDAEASLAVARARVEQLAEAARIVEATEAEIAEATEQLEDATLWAETLGRNGIQAMLIDACKEQIGGVVNDLLREADPRFTFRLETQTEKRTATAAEKRDGVALVEGLALEVHDATLPPTEDGRPRWQDARTLSGGQRAIVGAAYRLALVLYQLRQAGASSDVDILLDEHGKGLDAESAREFVTALRKVVVKAGFHRLIFILHSEAAHELADCRLVVHGGRVLIEGRDAVEGVAPLALAEVA